MTDSVPGQSGRPDEPQCYNCGGMGHWAVACHEPTRETPAGLAAWRSSSNTKQDHNRSRQVDGRRSKGPIITKYAPPPASGYAPGYQPPPNYPPPPPGAYSGPSPPQYPPQYQYPQHGTGLPPPPPPGYAQPSYPQPPYPPPTQYGVPHPTQSHPGPPPGTSPPNHGMPHGYSHYPGYGQEGHAPFVPPRPAYSGSYPQQSPNKQRNQQHSPQSHRVPAPSPKAKDATPAGTKTPPQPPAPGTGALSLPPKPPKSVHEFQGTIPDQRNNKRKHDRQNRNRDNRDNRDSKQRDQQPGGNQGSPKGPHNTPNRRPSHGQHNQQSDRRGQRPRSRDNAPTGGAHFSPPGNAQRRKSSSVTDGAQHIKASPSAKQTKIGPTPDAKETDSPLFNKLTANSAFSNPSLPPKPATTQENRSLSKADHGSETTQPKPEDENVEKLPSKNVEDSDADFHHDSHSQRNGVRSREAHSDAEDGSERRIKRPRHDSRERQQSPAARKPRHNDDLPRRSRSPSRARSRQRQPSVASHRSRSSSASSRSSGLDSLEAELLGRPVKRRPSGDSDTKKRPERSLPVKMKKRRQTNSAFSRRW